MKKTFLSISTKTGDQGTTSLANGERISKVDPLFDLIGTVDELNSWLGLVVTKLAAGFASQKNFLLEVQNQLFFIGAELALAPKVTLEKSALTKLEKTSEKLQKEMVGEWHKKFLLPGGTEQGAYLDIVRTIARRTERLAFKYASDHQISELILKYLNRLSDYLYILRCYINHAVEYQEKQFDKTSQSK